MMTHQEHSTNVDEPHYSAGEVAVDRRTLLKVIPATVVAGERRHGTGRRGKVRCWGSGFRSKMFDHVFFVPCVG